MQFQNALFAGTLLQRYKRFLADVRLDDGTIITVHCPNSGAMLGVKDPGSRVWLSRSDNPKRAYAYTWEIVKADDGLVGINTRMPNILVEEALQAKRIPELVAYNTLRREVNYGTRSRIDFLLEEPGLPSCYVEVKNVHLRRTDDVAEFPDCVTSRGAKHMLELSKIVAQGNRAVIFYVVQRQDCRSLKIAHDIDACYGRAYQHALLHGVEQICYQCDVTVKGITLSATLPFVNK